ncbi:NAD(P)/FAD-dependent oxidoreductase [Sphingomonas arantia]|uniref:NAD(P)/FAD-dependent oxidoreductase n=1 Tax=Sphingomonas arantia TaxID=1460676 RepID=A0ABW4TUZ2_9SPHN
MSMRVAIIGAGMAGLSCAERLVAGGHQVTLFDKGRGPGGRMATRRLDTPLGQVTCDMGAQYFTARDPDFVARVAHWEATGVVARWPAMGDDAWVGTPAMNAPLRAMADAGDVRWGTRIDAIVRGADGWSLQAGDAVHGGFEAVVVAVPAEQVPALVEAWVPAFAAQARATPSLPCWTVLAVFDALLPIGDAPVRRAGIIDFAARGGSKPGRGGVEAWTVHATADWSAAHLEDDAGEVQAAVLAALGEVAGVMLPAPVVATAHRWRFARSGAVGCEALWDRATGIGVCGDWLSGPRVEGAWVSGRRLAEVLG